MQKKICPRIIKYNVQERKGLPSLFITCLKEEKQLTDVKKKLTKDLLQYIKKLHIEVGVHDTLLHKVCLDIYEEDLIFWLDKFELQFTTLQSRLDCGRELSFLYCRSS